MPKSLAPALILALLVLAPCPAHAWPTPREKAQNLFKEGKAAYDKAQYAEALANFQAAAKLIHRASLLIMTARTYRRLNRTRMALEYYATYKSVWQQENPGKPSPHAEEVAEQLAALSRTTAQVKEAQALGRKGLHLEALALLNQALKGAPWPRIYAELARCYLAPGRPDRATESLKVALAHWEGYRLSWSTRHPGTAPPRRRPRHGQDQGAQGPGAGDPVEHGEARGAGQGSSALPGAHPRTSPPCRGASPRTRGAPSAGAAQRRPPGPGHLHPGHGPGRRAAGAGRLRGGERYIR